MQRFLTVLLTLALIAGVGYGLYRSVGGALKARQTVTVKGVIGSEKEDFFKAPEVVKALRDKGFIVNIEKAGSRQIATLDLKGYDFAFPAGVPAAEKIRREKGGKGAINVFYSPMAIATWDPIAKILRANGVSGDRGTYDVLNLERMIALMESGKRWSELKDADAYPVGRSVLINSTDVRRSNSAAMYLSLLSYVLNNNNVVQSGEEAAAVLPKISPLFLKQGYQEASSAGPFEDYLLLGMGKAPLVMIYEQQFIEKAAQKQLRSGMRLMYPKPTLFTKHVLVPLSDNGQRLGELLATDPEMQALALKFGFRTANPKAFDDFIAQQGLKLPTDLVDVIDPPSYEVLENMIKAIESEYTNRGAPPPRSDGGEAPVQSNMVPGKP